MAEESQVLMNIEQAVGAAVEYLKHVYPAAEVPRVEETELSEDDLFWLITLSFYLKDPGAEPGVATAIELGMIGKRRSFRVFKIDRRSGEVRSMKIRDRLNV